jgi:TLD
MCEMIFFYIMPASAQIAFYVAYGKAVSSVLSASWYLQFPYDVTFLYSHSDTNTILFVTKLCFYMYLSISTMGNLNGTTASTSSSGNDGKDNQVRRNDLRMLGDRVSFGDDELIHLYDAYNLFWEQQQQQRQLHSQQQPQIPEEDNALHDGRTCSRNSSFLYDWYKAILTKENQQHPIIDAPTIIDNDDDIASNPPPTVEIIENKKLQSIQNVIRYILPPNFDGALYKACFTVPEDPIHGLYRINSTNRNDVGSTSNTNETAEKEQGGQVLSELHPTTEGGEIVSCANQLKQQPSLPSVSAPNLTLVDEYTRSTRLCTFFEALSCCNGRRSAKECVTLLFRTLFVLQQVNESSVSSTTTTTTNPPQAEQRISARMLVETGYLFALALAYLQQQQQQQEPSDATVTESLEQQHDVLQQYVPTLGDKNDVSNASLQAMAMSIVEKRRSRQKRQPSDWNTMTMDESQSTSSSTSTNTKDTDDTDDWIELCDVLEWVDLTAPMFPYILPTFFHYILFPNATALPKSRTIFTVPTMNGGSHAATATIVASSHKILSVRNFVLACFTPALNGLYFPLYTSNDDGLSFNRLQNAILGYSGPTLFLLRSESGGIFGAYTSTAWKESKDFYGNTDCFLYQLWPRTALYRPSGNDRNFMYCNSTARSRGYDQQAHGIGFGGTVLAPRLFLAENFDDCLASSQDLTFDNGPLLPNVGTSGYPTTTSNDNSTTNAQHQQPHIQLHRSSFDIECLEVWGVGGSMDVVQVGLSARETNRANTAELIRKARKVDKAQFLDDFRAGTISSKAFAHRQQVDGRAEADLEERTKDKDKVYNYA